MLWQWLVQTVTTLYVVLSTLERRFFYIFPFLVAHPRARVISIGNLAVGGTGKTPVLLELLHDAELRRCSVVLSRGYRSPWERSFYLLCGIGPHPEGITDEALMINARFADLPVLLGKNRAHASRCAEVWFAPRLIFLDDGFQYRRLRHDVDIVLWDVTLPPDRWFPLPHGRLREPLARLRAASVLLLTRADMVSTTELQAQEQFLRAQGVTCPMLAVALRPNAWLDPDGQIVSLAQGPTQGVLLTAIARPDVLLCSLEKLGCRIRRAHCRRDHDWFPAAQITAVGLEAREYGGVPIVTEKDRIKIPATAIREQQIWTLLIRTRLLDGGSLPDRLRQLGSW